VGERNVMVGPLASWSDIEMWLELFCILVWYLI